MQAKKNNQGFTLIELISIILILAIIALIAIPIVSKLVEEAKKQSFKETATNVVDAVTKDCNIKLQTGGTLTQTYNLENYEVTSGQKISVSGKLPLQGNIAVNDTCDVAIAVNNNKWCVSKNYSDDKVTISDYVDGSCTYDGSGSSIDPGKGLLKDKILSLRSSELSSGVNLGSDEYDLAIANSGSSINYYTDKFFTGTNPNNYITVDGKEFRILGLTSQGVAVEGASDSYITDEGYGNITLNTAFYNRYNILGLVKNASYFSSTINGFDNSFSYDTSYKLNYGASSSNAFSLLSFYDYESTIDRSAYATCLKNSTASEGQTAFTDCAQTSWLGNNIYLNIGFYFYGTGAISPGYLASGKFAIADSGGNADDGVCTDCTKKIKLLIRNDSYYVSGTGTKSDPFVYLSAYDPNSFKQTDCFFLDDTGNTIVSFDKDNDQCSKDIVIPATINSKPITGIASNAFNGNNISSVDFSKATNLTSIGNYAFASNLITGSLTLPSNLETIGDGAFVANSISGALTIPSKVQSIGYNAFDRNSIESLSFANGSVLNYLGEQAFSENSNLIGTIDLPGTITSVGDTAFCWTNISVINIPNSLTGFSSGTLNCTPDSLIVNVDKAYNGLEYSPWGNANATINWLRAQSYNLTYDTSALTITSSGLNGSKYYAGATINVAYNQAGYKLVSYKVNGVTVNANNFIMPSEDATITDIVTVQVQEIQSAHPYSNNMNQTYTSTVAGATKIKVTFGSLTYVESGYDKIYLTDSTGAQVGSSTYYTAGSLASQEFIVTGDTINIRLTSDSSVTAYGFYATVEKYE